MTAQLACVRLRSCRRIFLMFADSSTRFHPILTSVKWPDFPYPGKTYSLPGISPRCCACCRSLSIRTAAWTSGITWLRFAFVSGISHRGGPGRTFSHRIRCNSPLRAPVSSSRNRKSRRSRELEALTACKNRFISSPSRNRMEASTGSGKKATRGT